MENRWIQASPSVIRTNPRFKLKTRILFLCVAAYMNARVVSCLGTSESLYVVCACMVLLYVRLSLCVNVRVYIRTCVRLHEYVRRCPWCNGYHRRKWTRRHEFKSWTRLIALHTAQISLGKVWIQLFSLQLWVNSRTDWVLQPWWDN